MIGRLDVMDAFVNAGLLISSFLTLRLAFLLHWSINPLGPIHEKPIACLDESYGYREWLS